MKPIRSPLHPRWAGVLLGATLADCAAVREVRGLGLMIGIEFARPEDAQAVCRRALERGVIALPSGGLGEVISLTPPLSIAAEALDHAVAILIELAEQAARTLSKGGSKE